MEPHGAGSLELGGAWSGEEMYLSRGHNSTKKVSQSDYVWALSLRESHETLIAQCFCANDLNNLQNLSTKYTAKKFSTGPPTTARAQTLWPI